MLQTLVWVIHIAAALGVVGLVLLQHGKGADMGAAFGSGSAGGLFGASGAANFLSRSTAVLAAVFFSTSLLLTAFSGQGGGAQSVMQQVSVPVPLSQPVTTTPTGTPAPGSHVTEIPK